jgi:hypothetical protein
MWGTRTVVYRTPPIWVSIPNPSGQICATSEGFATPNRIFQSPPTASDLDFSPSGGRVALVGAPATSVGRREPRTVSDSKGLMGTRHNGARIDRLASARADGMVDGMPWHVGILYEPDDPSYQMTDLIGVVTESGHVGCFMPGYFYIRPFIEALFRKTASPRGAGPG